MYNTLDPLSEIYRIQREINTNTRQYYEAIKHNNTIKADYHKKEVGKLRNFVLKKYQVIL